MDGDDPVPDDDGSGDLPAVAPVTSAVAPGTSVVEVCCTAAEAELVADHLLVLGASAVAERPADAPLSAAAVVLTADLPSAALEHLRTLGVEFRTVDPGTAWRETWRSHAVAERAGPFVVVPAWVDEPVQEGEVRVVVDPGHAFGSGSHPTTRLCLAALADVVEAGGSVLDVGCGSGVLGVGALLLGAGTLVAIDIDPAAVAATAEVAALNGVADRVAVGDTSLHEVAGEFDLVLANLLIPVIEELGAGLVARVRPGGHLVASGLLEAQVARAVDALAPMAVVDSRDEDGWVALTLRRG